jgi:peptidoglycan hydrolase CwlO-like protein
MRKVVIISIFIMGILCSANHVFASEYDPTYPPALFPSQIIKEKDYEAFQFVGKDLLIPDKIEFDKAVYEIIQEEEESRFEPIAVFELDGFYDPQKAKPAQPKQPDSLLAYKQSMWLKGLEIASRDYRISQYEQTRSDGFKINFQEDVSGKIRATLTLYQNKPEPLEEIKGELKGLKTEIQKLQEKISEWSSEIGKKLTEVKEKSDSLETKIAAIENTNAEQANQLQILKDDIQNLESKIDNLSKETH